MRGGENRKEAGIRWPPPPTGGLLIEEVAVAGGAAGLVRKEAGNRWPPPPTGGLLIEEVAVAGGAAGLVRGTVMSCLLDGMGSGHRESWGRGLEAWAWVHPHCGVWCRVVTGVVYCVSGGGGGGWL